MARKTTKPKGTKTHSVTIGRDAKTGRFVTVQAARGKKSASVETIRRGRAQTTARKPAARKPTRKKR